MRLLDRYGYVEPTGRLAIQPQFDYAESFHQGLALVVSGNSYQYIDRTGKVITPTC